MSHITMWMHRKENREAERRNKAARTGIRQKSAMQWSGVESLDRSVIFVYPAFCECKLQARFGLRRCCFPFKGWTMLN